MKRECQNTLVLPLIFVEESSNDDEPIIENQSSANWLLRFKIRIP